MRTATYAIIAAIAIIGYNLFLIERDQKMFDAYDRACAELPQPHPDCFYAK
jgi:hypothetical protein